jgi:hypothetical protein
LCLAQERDPKLDPANAAQNRGNLILPGKEGAHAGIGLERIRFLHEVLRRQLDPSPIGSAQAHQRGDGCRNPRARLPGRRAVMLYRVDPQSLEADRNGEPGLSLELEPQPALIYRQAQHHRRQNDAERDSGGQQDVGGEAGKQEHVSPVARQSGSRFKRLKAADWVQPFSSYLTYCRTS